MLLDSILNYAFEDFGIKHYILSDGAEDYNLNNFPDMKQDKGKWIMNENLIYILRRAKANTKFQASFQIKIVFNIKYHVWIKKV